MKKLAFVATVFVGLASSFGAALSPEDFGCQDAKAVIASGGTLELGQWYTDWNACKTYADANNLPVFFIWSNKTCVHCQWTDQTLVADGFKTWAANNDAGKVIYCFMAGGENKYPDQKGSTAYNWMWKGTGDGGGTKLNAYPFVCLWWKAKGVNARYTGDDFCSGNGFNASTHLNADSIPQRIPNVIAKMESAFKDWHPTPTFSYHGGWFTQTNYPYATPEAESTTTRVDVELKRTSAEATTQTIKIGDQAETVTWPSNTLSQVYTIKDFNTKYFKPGTDVVLQLLGPDKDGNDEVKSETKVKCFSADEEKPSAANPRWSGAEFGEWTMDFAAATNEAAKADGYTLVLMAGSLWCPDCYNVDTKFLANPKFGEWATANKIALVQVDLPPLSGGTVMAPTLLSREEGTGYFDKDGKVGAFTKSGLGYMTRKMLSAGDAKAVFDRNVVFAQKSADEGGFHRPGDGKYRPGVPYFLMLRKDGTLAARLTQWAVSTKDLDDKKFDDYLKRFDEMLAIAGASAGHADPTEIENNDPTSANPLTLDARSGVATNEVSNTDPKDAFRLTGNGGNSRQVVTVKGVGSSAEVVVSFLKPDASGLGTVLAATTNVLTGGIAFTNDFTRGGEYFVKVEAESITNEAFRLDADSTFQKYEIGAEVVALVPQTDRVTAEPNPGETSVKVDFLSNTVYRLSGLDLASLPAALRPYDPQPVEGVTNFFTAVTGGIVSVPLDLTGAATNLTYQAWDAGSNGFENASLEVDHGYCDDWQKAVEIPVCRMGGLSGWTKATVVIDTNNFAYAQGRVYIGERGNPTNAVTLCWEDGDDAPQTVKVWIENDLGMWDERTEVKFEITDIDSEYGEFERFAAKVDEGHKDFSLVITAVVSGSAGEVVISSCDPAVSRGEYVFVREGEPVTLTAVRKGGNGQLVAALLKATPTNVVFETEDKRDLDDIEKEYPNITNQAFYAKLAGAKFLWWNGKDHIDGITEKKVTISGIPAGSAAQIQVMALEPLENAGDYGSITIVALAGDAPGFVSNSVAIAADRYTVIDEKYPLVNVQSNDTVKFTKLAGTLPAGLKATVATGADGYPCLAVAGIVKARPGTYTASYRVLRKNGSGWDSGTTIALNYTVYDLSKFGPNGESPNPIVALRSRTFKGIPVLDPTNECMVGTLQVTVPPTGKVSAKFACEAGTYSFSAKGWDGSRGPDGTVEALLASRKTKATIRVAAGPNGAVYATFSEVAGAWDDFQARTDGRQWSRRVTAVDWAGYYTVALKYRAALEGSAPVSHGYLTINMPSNSVSAVSRGSFRMAGMLPDGTKVSGSYTLQQISGKGCLPVFYRSSRNVLAALVVIEKNAWGDPSQRGCVGATLRLFDGDPEEGVAYDAVWTHRGSSDPDFAAAYGVSGSYYNPAEDLCSCITAEGKTSVRANFVIAGKSYPVTVTAHDIRPDGSDLKLAFDAKTGVVDGSLALEGVEVPYSGVVVSSGSTGCNVCGPADDEEKAPVVPFMYGGACLKGAKGLLGSWAVTLEAVGN